MEKTKGFPVLGRAVAECDWNLLIRISKTGGDPAEVGAARLRREFCQS